MGHEAGAPIGLTGAVTATRYVGGTASVAPTTGTFAVGDFVITADGKIYICTTAGTPGTWELIRGKPLALTGATAATRYVGATASGAPASGTFAVGDFVIDQTGHVRVCTVAGTPGTWVDAGAAGANAASSISVNSTTLVGVGTDVQAVLEELDDAVAAGGGGGTFSGLVAFSGSIEPPQLTADANDYNPTGVATASVIRVSSNATRLMSGLAATATNGRIVTLQNTGSFDIILRQDSSGSAAGNRFKIPASMNLKPNESVILQYDTTASRWRMIGGVPDSPPSTVLDNFYVATYGSDSNDGRSWKSAMLTPAAAITAAAGTGDIFFGPGTFTWADTLTVSQGVRLHGKSSHAAASGGTEFVWTGADDGRTGLITAANASADWTQGVIENIRFTGSGVGMSGGGTCLAIRNIQNAGKLFNVRVVGWDTGIGIRVYSTSNTGFPGYAHFENVWVSGAVTGWDIECPMTNLLFSNCGSDPVATHGTLRSWVVRAAQYPYGAGVLKTIASSSQSGAVATHVATAHGLSVGYFVDISGTSVAGYDGVFYVASVADANTFTVNCGALTGLGASTGGTAVRCVNGDRGTLTFNSCKSESSCADAGWQFRGSSGIVMIGCEYFEQSDNAAGIAFEYRGPIHNGSGDITSAPRAVLLDCVSQNMEYQFVAPFHGVSIKPENGYTGGRFGHITYTGRTNSPLIDIVGTSVPANPVSGTRRMFTDPATGEVSVRTSAGATVSLEATGGAGAPSTADYLVATANGGLSAEIVVGATPGGELGGSWASPTVDATHAGTTHSAASDTHVADTTTAHAAASVDAVATGGGGTETVKAVGNTGSTETIVLALSDGNVQTFTVNADCVFTMPSSLGAGAKSFTAILTDSGGPRTITFTGVKWSGGANPTVMSGAGGVDIFTFLTIDGGTTWYGFIGGQAMAV